MGEVLKAEIRTYTGSITEETLVAIIRSFSPHQQMIFDAHGLLTNNIFTRIKNIPYCVSVET
jgi:hypothetical protein